MKAVEQRKALRFQPADGRVLLVKKDGPLRGVPSREADTPFSVVNVSTSGLCFHAPVVLPPGEELLLSFSARHLGPPLVVRALVVWCRSAGNGNGGAFHVGVSFLGLRPPDRTRLERLPGWVDLARIQIDPALARYIPSALARRRRVVPFFRDGGLLHVAMADPRDTAAMEALRRHARMQIKAYQADEKHLSNCVALLYGEGDGPARTGAAEDSRAVTFLDDLLRAALMRGASDLHLEPEPPRRVRFRVDGRLTQGQRRIIDVSSHAPITPAARAVARLTILGVDQGSAQRVGIRWGQSGCRLNCLGRRGPGGGGRGQWLRCLGRGQRRRRSHILRQAAPSQEESCQD